MTEETVEATTPKPKQTRKPRAAVEAAEPVTPQASDFITIAEPKRDKFDNLRAQAISKIMENRTKEEPTPVPPPMTQRMLSRREKEMEAGRRRVAIHAERSRVNPPPKPAEPAPVAV